MSYGLHGHGATLKVCANSSFTTVTTYGDLISITGPNESRDPIDYSTMDSTSKWREFLAGMVDTGDITVELNYNGGDTLEAEALQAQLTNSTQYWRITMNDNPAATTDSWWQSAGFVTGLGFAIPFDDKVTQSLTIKATGQPTFSNYT